MNRTTIRSAVMQAQQAEIAQLREENERLKRDVEGARDEIIREQQACQLWILTATEEEMKCTALESRLAQALVWMKQQHTVFSHDYIKDEKVCKDCKLIRALEETR